jgi:predicted DNA-binding transcriptional regulator AlpA
MLSVIKNLLLKVIDDIDSGNSKIPEDKEMEIIKYIKSFTDTTQRISKYKACEYLNISRATFDNYVREGKLPKGKKVAGFKELSWTKRDLDDFILKYKNSHNTL